MQSYSNYRDDLSGNKTCQRIRIPVDDGDDEDGDGSQCNDDLFNFLKNNTCLAGKK